MKRACKILTLKGSQRFNDSIKNIKMVEAAREEAVMLLKNDPNLKKHPIIKERVDRASAEIYFE